jgi:hypothetical protein
MRPIGILTILFVLAPAAAMADETPRKTAEPAPPAIHRWPNPADLVAPGVLRQDLFDRRNPTNWRHDNPTPPAQPGQF